MNGYHVIRRRDLAAEWHDGHRRRGMRTRHLRFRFNDEPLIDYAREMERVIVALEAKLAKLARERRELRAQLWARGRRP